MRNSAKIAYTPPFTVTAKAVSLVAEIGEALGGLAALAGAGNLRLRRINRIRTIHGSLAITPQVSPQVTPQVGRFLGVLHGEMSGGELQQHLGWRDRKSIRERYLAPALAEGLVEITIPERPNSRLQKYRLTRFGKSMLRGQ